MALREPPDSAARFIPDKPTLPALRAAAKACTGCPLYQRATQVVFGEGAARADLMLIGEQPGDREDLAGAPFVGPAGQLLDRALADAGIDRRRTYVTNAVKHFKWTPRGKRRMHSKPSVLEVRACHPWLAAEIAVVRPALLVCLGATAAAAVLGPAFRVLRDRGRVVRTADGRSALGTIHPSALLRMEDEDRATAYRSFVEDLRQARAAVAAAA